MKNQTNFDASKVINKLLNKITIAEYNQSLLETKVEELTEKLKEKKEAK